MMHGRTQFNKVSRFVSEIPEDLLEIEDKMSFREKDPQRSLFSVNRKQVFTKPYQKARQFTVLETAKIDYEVGDMVSHVKFGRGEVMEIVQGGRDYEVTVQFEKSGAEKNVCFVCKIKKN